MSTLIVWLSLIHDLFQQGGGEVDTYEIILCNKFSTDTPYHQTDKGPMGKVVNGSLDVIDCDHQRLFLLIVW